MERRFERLAGFATPPASSVLSCHLLVRRAGPEGAEHIWRESTVAPGGVSPVADAVLCGPRPTGLPKEARTSVLVSGRGGLVEVRFWRGANVRYTSHETGTTTYKLYLNSHLYVVPRTPHEASADRSPHCPS